MKRWILALLAAVMPMVAQAQVTTTQGETKQLCRLWDGTDVLGIDGSGNITCNAGTGTFTISGSVTANAGTDLNTSALLTTAAHDAAFGTAGAADSQVRTIQGVASMTPVRVDNGGTFATQATQAGTWTVQPGNTANTTPWLMSIAEGGVTADVLDLTNSNPLTTAIVDGSGNQITSFGGGTQYTEGDTDASITGTALMWEDAADTLRPVSASKPLPVNVVLGGGTGGTSSAFGAAFPGTGTAVGFTDGTNMQPARAYAVGVSGTELTLGVSLRHDSGGIGGSVEAGTVTAPFVVAGAVADGVAVSQNPVRIAGKDGSGNTQDIITDASGELQVDVLTLPSNASVNLAQVAGSAVATGNGTAAGSLRVSVASDSTGQIAIASMPNEGQQTAANSISVTPDTDNDSIASTGAAPPGEVTQIGAVASGATGGLLSGITVCDSFANVTISTATTTLIVTGVSGRHVRICALSLITAAANNVALISGTGATCGTGTTGMNGGTTAATGYNLAANGGIAQGSGLGEINRTNATGDSVCIITSASTQLSGRVSYAIY